MKERLTGFNSLYSVVNVFCILKLTRQLTILILFDVVLWPNLIPNNPNPSFFNSIISLLRRRFKSRRKGNVLFQSSNTGSRKVVSTHLRVWAEIAASANQLASLRETTYQFSHFAIDKLNLLTWSWLSAKINASKMKEISSCSVRTGIV